MIVWFFFLAALANSMADFGMNKPHYLFHLGDRSSVSHNIGWGYWLQSQMPRMKYKNKKDGLYAAMDVHNGQTCFQESISDEKNKVESVIKYQLQKQHWETSISMQNQFQIAEKTISWFTYFSVENNDYRFVDHEKYTTFISLSAKYLNPNHIVITSESSNGYIEKYAIQSNEQLKIFGLTANISETYTIDQISNQFAHLIQASKNPNITRKTEQKILKWENAQLQLIKENQWEDKKFVILFIYGPISQTNVFITNSTTAQKFNEQSFNKKVQQIQALYSQKGQKSEIQKFMKHVIYNLYGGVTFYFGRLYTQNSLIVHKQDYCYSFTPSRLIFPRSFLWDDGFHQMVVVKYNPDIVIDVLKGWMRKVDIFGWIGREQIRGNEISAMMPDNSYVFQDWFQMNPPTLMLPLIYLIQNRDRYDDETQDKSYRFMKENYKKLEQWYRYFKNTQSHQSLQYPQTLNNSIFYRWQCKDDCKKGNFMGSGLDDYPRRQNETELAKQHVDIVSWLYFFSNSLNKIGRYIEDQGDVTMKKKVIYYQRQAQTFKEELYKNFFDHQDYLFKDVVVVNSNEYVEKFVHKIGYINLFPFFTGLLQDQDSHKIQRVQSLKKCLQIMMNENLLLASDGLRSLSLSDQLYGTDQNYWRGAVWLPINYLVLRACKLYYWNDEAVFEQVREFYGVLRERLINTVYENYKQTGYLFENYHEGKGHRGYPFYGWTSLIANIISETY